MKVVLYQPQIPQNTGNIVRTCRVTGNDLILIAPLGFSTDDRFLKRSGLDYWEGVNVKITEDLDKLLEEETTFYFFSSKASILYTEASYTKNCALIFGSETAGLPLKYFELFPERFRTLPMLPGVRCLNLATSVGITVYEAWRQQHFQS